MSDQDREIVSSLNLSQNEVAELLGRSRQAISKGIGNKDHNYLGIDRLRVLVRALNLRGDLGRSQRLRRLARDLFPDQASLFRGADFSLIDDDPRPTSFSEMWVVSTRPREVQEVRYTQEMIAAHLSDETKRIAYFVPFGGVGQELAEEFKLRESSIRARVRVQELPGVELAPHYVIFEPLSGDRSRGFVRTSAYDFALLPKDETNRAVVALNRALLAENGRLVYSNEDRAALDNA